MRDITDNEKAQMEHLVNSMWSSLSETFIKDYKRLGREYEVANRMFDAVKLPGAGMILSAAFAKLQVDFAEHTGKVLQVGDLRGWFDGKAD